MVVKNAFQKDLYKFVSSNIVLPKTTIQINFKIHMEE